jgi:hypothetical protein
MTTKEKERSCLVALSAALNDSAKSESERAQFRGLLVQLDHALGHLGQRYCSGRRNLSSFQLKETFNERLGRARTEGASLRREIQERAHGLNLSQLPSLVRGGQ